jgi:alpha-D-ribose 1-methylphosphonate 5-triphosphate synthase subunit PhnG
MMFQASDSATSDEMRERRNWMELLARAPLAMLENWIRSAGGGDALPARIWLRKPEVGLAMLRARTGGAGERFNLGEVTLTRCTLRIETGEVGVAYVKGRSLRQAELAAFADALLQAAPWREAVRSRLIEPIRAHLEIKTAHDRHKAQATRVEFLTLAREAGK